MKNSTDNKQQNKRDEEMNGQALEVKGENGDNSSTFSVTFRLLGELW